MAAVFEATIGGRFAVLNLLENNTFTESKRQQQTCLGRRRRRTNHGSPMTSLTYAHKAGPPGNQESGPRGNRVNPYVQRTHHEEKIIEAKEQWIRDQCDRIDSGLREGTSKATATFI